MKTTPARTRWAKERQGLVGHSFPIILDEAARLTPEDAQHLTGTTLPVTLSGRFTEPPPECSCHGTNHDERRPRT